MTLTERAEALGWHGYTPRQAAFLALVLVHGGYFLRRQFAAFLGREDGGLVTDLARRVVRYGHGRRHVFRRGTEVVHVFARALYQAIEESDCRYRRAVSLATMRQRLMLLDLVLAHPTATFLATEREKIAYFRELVREDLFPGRWTTAPNATGRPRHHVFVDKAPMFVEPPSRQLQVAYIQPPGATLAGLVHWLKDYERLFTRLPSPTVVVCTAGDQAAAAAALAVVGRWRQTRPTVLEDVPESQWRGQIVTYFRALREVRGRWGQWVPGANVAWFAADRQRFGDARLRQLHDDWDRLGNLAIERFCMLERVPRLDHVQVRAEVLPHRYDFLGTALSPPPRRSAAA
jgi:hypothetical protein